MKKRDSVHKFLGLSILVGLLCIVIPVVGAPSGITGGRALEGLLGLGRWQPIQGLELGSVDVRSKWESAWVRETIADDPAAEAIVSSYLSGLASAGYSPERQGVWVAEGQFPVAQYQGDIPRSAASITKVATTLAALATWGPMHRFETLVGWQGKIENGVLNGDLIVEGGNDPLFVWEEAIALGNSLQKLGIRRVTGSLIVANGFSMNFETSSGTSGLLLKQAMNAPEWDYAIEYSYAEMAPGTPQPTLQIDGQVQTTPNSFKNQASGWFIRHESMPLVAVLKAMNIYSNNIMAQQIADAVGGTEAVMSQVEAAAGIMPSEISLSNGSGLGEENRMSPRAAVTMMQKIQDLLRSSASETSQNFTISDIFPITGSDGGTVRDRGLPPNTVVKTGTLAVVSALAGALPTQKRGVVWFSLLNYGSDLDGLRSRQDQVISALEQQWGKASEIPLELQTTVRIGTDPYRFGDERRNQAIYRPAG